MRWELNLVPGKRSMKSWQIPQILSSSCSPGTSEKANKVEVGRTAVVQVDGKVTAFDGKRGLQTATICTCDAL